jgi:hypothetical protein
VKKKKKLSNDNKKQRLSTLHKKKREKSQQPDQQTWNQEGKNTPKVGWFTKLGPGKGVGRDLC